LWRRKNWDDYKSHQYLSEADVSGKRVLIVGDIHGCMGELYDIMRKADILNEEEDRVKDDAVLITSGDFINKGPRSREVVQWIMKNDNVYASTGNHEINILNNPSKYPWSLEMTEEEWDFVTYLPWTVSVPDAVSGYTVVVTHGGLMPDVPLENQEEFVLTRMRNLIPDGNGGWIASDERDDGYAWATVWSGPEHVVFGHDAGRRLQQEAFATGLDTRCVYGEYLTGIWLPIENQEFINVPCEAWDPFEYNADSK